MDAITTKKKIKIEWMNPNKETVTVEAENIEQALEKLGYTDPKLASSYAIYKWEFVEGVN